ncbi:MAG: hypothetical protein EZS28_015511, partial [Streblomastix strix]
MLTAAKLKKNAFSNEQLTELVMKCLSNTGIVTNSDSPIISSFISLLEEDCDQEMLRLTLENEYKPSLAKAVVDAVAIELPKFGGIKQQSTSSNVLPPQIPKQQQQQGPKFWSKGTGYGSGQQEAYFYSEQGGSKQKTVSITGLEKIDEQELKQKEEKLNKLESGLKYINRVLMLLYQGQNGSENQDENQNQKEKEKEQIKEKEDIYQKQDIIESNKSNLIDINSNKHTYNIDSGWLEKLSFIMGQKGLKLTLIELLSDNSVISMAKSTDVMNATFDLLLHIKDIFYRIPPKMQNELALELYRPGSGIAGAWLAEDVGDEYNEKKQSEIQRKKQQLAKQQKLKEGTNLTVYGQIEKMRQAAEIFLKLDKQSSFKGDVEDYAYFILNKNKEEQEKGKIIENGDKRLKLTEGEINEQEQVKDKDQDESCREVAARVIDVHKQMNVMKIASEIVINQINKDLKQNNIKELQEWKQKWTWDEDQIQDQDGNEENFEISEDEMKIVEMEKKKELYQRQDEEYGDAEIEKDLIDEDQKDDEEEEQDEEELNQLRKMDQVEQKGQEQEQKQIESENQNTEINKEINELIDLIMNEEDEEEEEEEEDEYEYEYEDDDEEEEQTKPKTNKQNQNKEKISSNLRLNELKLKYPELSKKLHELKQRKQSRYERREEREEERMKL